MKPVYHANAIGKDRGLILNQMVRRQAARTLSDAHRAAGGVKPQTQFSRRMDRILQPCAIWIEVQVIRTQRTSRKRQLSQPHLRRDMKMIGRHPRPDRIQRLQPAKQERILPRRHSPRQRLVQMVMGVYQTRCDHAALCLHDLARAVQAGSDLRDDTAGDKDVTIGQLAALIIHRNNGLGIFDKKFKHRTT